MHDISLLKQPGYQPGHLLDTLIEVMGLRYDASLAERLDVAPPVISNIRHLRLAVGAKLLLRMHEVSNLSIKDLRELMGDRRPKFGFMQE